MLYINIYSKHFKFIAVSAHNKQNVEEIKNLLKNNISAFAGQSGVGKSALINAIFGDETTKEGYLSAKITRGKNTTRHVSLYKLSPKTYIADTPGFSALDEKLLPINENQLPYYYPEFLPLLKECKFKSCLHYKENIKDCAVKRALESGEVDKERYNRYITILNSLKEKLPY